jgi:signal recognition particle GTPase
MPGRILRRAGDVPTRSLWTKIKDVALTDVGALVRTGAIQGSLEKLEEVLLEADFGVATTMRLVAEIEGQARRGFKRPRTSFSPRCKRESRRRCAQATAIRVSTGRSRVRQ